MKKLLLFIFFFLSAPTSSLISCAQFVSGSAEHSAQAAKALEHCKNEDERKRLIAIMEQNATFFRRTREDNTDEREDEMLEKGLSITGIFCACALMILPALNDNQEMFQIISAGGLLCFSFISLFKNIFTTKSDKIAEQINLKKMKAKEIIANKAFAEGDYKTVAAL